MNHENGLYKSSKNIQNALLCSPFQTWQQNPPKNMNNKHLSEKGKLALRKTNFKPQSMKNRKGM